MIGSTKAREHGGFAPEGTEADDAGTPKQVLRDGETDRSPEDDGTRDTGEAPTRFATSGFGTGTLDAATAGAAAHLVTLASGFGHLL